MKDSLWRNVINGLTPIASESIDDEIEDASSIDLEAFIARMFRGYLPVHHTFILVDALTRAAETPDSRLIITMPPRHGKSLHVSENLPAWFLGRYPWKRVIGASHTKRLANTFSRRVRNKLTDPRWPYRNVRLATDRSAVEQWDIAGHGGGYYSVGRGGSPAGVGADLIIIDDPIRSAKDADSPNVREMLWEWYRETMRTRLEPGGSIIVTATRWHEDDLTGRLLVDMQSEGEEFEHLHLPAIDDEGNPLWPERWTKPRLLKLKASVGTRAWNAQYQGQPTSDEGGTFKRWWWRFWHPIGQPLPPVPMKGPNGEFVLLPVFPRPPIFESELQSWDMAFSGEEDKAVKAKAEAETSWVVGQVWGSVAANRYLVNQVRDHFDFPRTLTALRSVSAMYPSVNLKLVENKANGPAVIQTLRNEIPGLVGVEPQGNKETRANAVSPQVESGNVYLPHPSIAPWVWEFIREHADFPLGKFNDQVDSTSQALLRFGTSARKGGSKSYLDRDGERDDDDRRGRRVDR